MTASAEPRLPPILEQVVAANTCSGCGLCAGIDDGVALRRDGKGWWRPAAVAAPKPESDAILREACPGATVAPWRPAPNSHDVWGPYHRCLTAWSTDAELRHVASSGGVLSSLALFALRTGRVDRVLHVGMDADHPLLTAIRRSVDREDLLAGAGSRYAPAAPLAELRAELARPGRILFIGKPCDAGAMRQMTRLDPALADRVPIILSFYCAGTPSQTGTDRILDELGVRPEEVASFRYRGDGWPGYAAATRADGSSERMTYADSWGRILCNDVQPRCKICPDAIGGAADVAAGDAWYEDESGYPSFAEAEGRSLVLTRTGQGDALMADAERAGFIATEPLAIAEVEKMQSSQAWRRRVVISRLMALRVMGRFTPRTRGLKLLAAARGETPLEHGKNAAGMIRRVLVGRI